MSLEILLLIVSFVIFICIIGGKLSSRFGLPTLFVFILLGMMFGSDGLFKIQFDDFKTAEKICSAALIFIMFYGGFGTRWSEAKPVAAKSILLSSVGVVLTSLFTGLFCYYVLKMDLLEGMLLGSVLGSTDAASVFSILRSRKLNLKYGSASMLELESGSNDPFAYMLTVLLLSMMSGTASVEGVIKMLAGQLIIGIVLGVVAALFASRFLSKFQFYGEGFDTIFVFAVAVLSYALSTALGGNGYLSTYLAGIILGNQQLKNQKTLVSFFDAFTGLMQILLFFLLGLLAFPSQMPKLIVPSALIALFLTFIARPLAVGLLMAPFKTPLNQYLVISWAGLRGAASIVFAIMATVSESYMKYDIFHMVFCVVLFSILFQGSLLPILAKKCNMIDENSDVMRTFTDFTEKMRIQFIQLSIGKNHPWVNLKIKDISLLPGILITVIKREDKVIVPKGNIEILEGDMVVIGAEGYSDDHEILLKEIHITPSHYWCGKNLSEAKFYKNTVIVMVNRGDQIIIPDGSTVIQDKDVVVTYSQKKPAAVAAE